MRDEAIWRLRTLGGVLPDAQAFLRGRCREVLGEDRRPPYRRAPSPTPGLRPALQWRQRGLNLHPSWERLAELLGSNQH